MDNKTEGSSSTLEIVPMISSIPDTEVRVQVSEALQNGYQWFAERNKQEALTYLEGLMIAWRHGISKQIELYKEKIIDIVTRDMADRAASLISQRMGVDMRFLYYHPGRSLPEKSFSVPIEKSGNRERKWIYRRIEHFSQLIPPQAMQVLALLEQAGIAPDGLWVAEIIETYNYSTRV